MSLGAIGLGDALPFPYIPSDGGNALDISNSPFLADRAQAPGLNCWPASQPGPLAPGQTYCETGTASAPIGVSDGASSAGWGWMGLAGAVIFLIGFGGGRRR